MSYKIITPAHLRSMRILSGLSRYELGVLMGGVPDSEVRVLERSSCLFSYDGHLKILVELLGQVDRALDIKIDVVTKTNTPYLFCYPNDDQFRKFEPILAKWMQFNSAHLAFTARLLDALAVGYGRFPTVVEIDQESYADFLAGLPDTPDKRIGWATLDYIHTVKIREGLPRRRVMA